MNKVDKLLQDANERLHPGLSDFDKLKQNNPYLDKSFEELLDMMDGSHDELCLGSSAWDKFVCAIMINQDMQAPDSDEIAS